MTIFIISDTIIKLTIRITFVWKSQISLLVKNTCFIKIDKLLLLVTFYQGIKVERITNELKKGLYHHQVWWLKDFKIMMKILKIN